MKFFRFMLVVEHPSSKRLGLLISDKNSRNVYPFIKNVAQLASLSSQARGDSVKAITSEKL